MEMIRLHTGKKLKLMITAGVVKEIKSVLGFSVIEVGKNGDIEKLLDSPIDLVNVLYLLCKDDCEEQKITDIQFGKGMDGNCLQEATEKFLIELENFLPLAKRTLLHQSLKMQKEIMEEVTAASIERMIKMKPEIVTMVQNEMNERLDSSVLKTSFSNLK